MLSMGSGAAGTTYGASFSGRVFPLTNVGVVTFSVSGLTNGTVTIQYSVDYRDSDPSSANWYSLDATNLVFAADGAKYAIWGECHVRAIGDGSVDGADLSVRIGGSNVMLQPVSTSS